MTDLDASFLAGFFDGEGCVRINSRVASPKSKRLNYQVQVVIGHTNKPILDWIAGLFGGNVLPRKSARNVKQQWFWCVYGDKARTFLQTISPHARIKREEVILALRFLSELKGAPSVKLDPEIYLEQQKVEKQMKFLKQLEFPSR